MGLQFSSSFTLVLLFFLEQIMSGNDMSGDILISNGDYCLYTYFFSFMLMRPGKMVLLLTLGFCMFMSEFISPIFHSSMSKNKELQEEQEMVRHFLLASR